MSELPGVKNELKGLALLKTLLRSVVLWGIAAITLLPLLMTFGGSITNSSVLYEAISPVLSGGSGAAGLTLLPSIPTLRQYISLLLDTPTFLSMFWNSVALVVPILLGQTVVGTLAAWGLSKFKFPGRQGLYLFYIALMMMPFQVMLVPTYLVLSQMNLMDTRWAVILPAIFSTLPVFMLYQFFRSVPDSLIEAAEIDGANELRIFVSLALPMGMPGVASLLVLNFMEYWNLVEQPMVFMRDTTLQPLSLYLTRIGESDLDVAFAASVITLLPSVLLFLYGETYLVSGIRLSGLKE